jgi:HK97 family phage prohead protease
LLGGENILKVELRNGTIHLEGYVNAVGRESRELRDMHGKFIEIIKPNAFKHSLERRPDVDLMLNHKRNLTPVKYDLYEDNIGLRAFIDIDDPEVVELAEHNKLTGFSFGFVAKADEWDTSSEIRKRTITDLDLKEVSILSVRPAYVGTMIEMRADELQEQRNQLSEVTTEDKRENLDYIETYKQHLNFLKGEY